MKILVTGGSGFLGRNLLQALKSKGYSFIRILNRSICEDLQQEGIEVICGDITNYEVVCSAIKNCDVVFHVAAKAGVWGSYRSYYQANVIGSKNVIKACQAHGVKYLIYTSSPSVVFNGKPLTNVDERVGYGQPSKMCAYAKTKMIAEKSVLAANGQNGLITVALRPHLIWGPGDRHLIPSIIQAARRRHLFQVGDGNNWVDISYVTNVAQAHISALNVLQTQSNRVAGKAYFISQGDPVQLWPWINQLLRHLNIAPVHQKISVNRAYLLGSCLEFLYKIFCIRHQPPMTRFIAKQLSQDHYFDISAAKMDLHYVPQISNEEGLERLVEWIKIQNF